MAEPTPQSWFVAAISGDLGPAVDCEGRLTRNQKGTQLRRASTVERMRPPSLACSPSVFQLPSPLSICGHAVQDRDQLIAQYSTVKADGTSEQRSPAVRFDCSMPCVRVTALVWSIRIATTTTSTCASIPWLLRDGRWQGAGGTHGSQEASVAVRARLAESLGALVRPRLPLPPPLTPHADRTIRLLRGKAGRFAVDMVLFDMVLVHASLLRSGMVHAGR